MPAGNNDSVMKESGRQTDLCSANYLYRFEAREILRYSAATREGSFMLGVQTYYARAASPAHLLYPLTLHTP